MFFALIHFAYVYFLKFPQYTQKSSGTRRRMSPRSIKGGVPGLYTPRLPERSIVPVLARGPHSVVNTGQWLHHSQVQGVPVNQRWPQAENTLFGKFLVWLLSNIFANISYDLYFKSERSDIPLLLNITAFCSTAWTFLILILWCERKVKHL